MTKRAYKLQEFVAHTSNVNCLKIGRKSSRVLVTGGEDAKVNMWAIGKPNAILSLSGHATAVESVTFDAAEVLVVAGAASGTIKLWDLEEAKIVRTLTGHRSNCISVSFHPFGEFFASGSLDTNLKIWDIRRKGCIHTYKGHTRGINTIKFSPDGRWVVSGGEDNSVKLWDLTAGKLMHDFKFHDGQIQCLDFHPHEFLLATGSADRTVKFWDLETFELIGSSGPEATGVRSMVFNPDGRTLLCAMHDSLKVLSWEPLRCHDAVDVGWSKLADLSIHEGKLLGCSYNQSCVGVWVVDLQRVSPFQVSNTSRNNTVGNLNGNGNQSVIQLAHGTLKSNGIRSAHQYESLDVALKEVTLAAPKSVESVPNTPHRITTPLLSRGTAPHSTATPVVVQTPRKITNPRVHAGNIARSVTRSDPLSNTGTMSDVGTVTRETQPVGKRVEEPSSSRFEGSMPVVGRPDNKNLEGLSGDAGADVIRLDSNMHSEAQVPFQKSLPKTDAHARPGGTNFSHRGMSRLDVIAHQEVTSSSQRGVVRQDVNLHHEVTGSMHKAVVRTDAGLQDITSSSHRVTGKFDANPHQEAIGSMQKAVVRTDASSHQDFTSSSHRTTVKSEANPHQDVTISSHRNISNGDKGSQEAYLPPGKLTSSDDGDNPPWKEPRRFKRSSSYGSSHSDPFLRGAPPQSFFGDVMLVPNTSRPLSSSEASTTGRLEVSRARGLISHWEGKERLCDFLEGSSHSGNGGPKTLGLDINSFVPRGNLIMMEKSGSAAPGDVELIEKLMQQHHTMASIMQSRLTNMQVVRRFWMKNDVKGAVEAMSRMTDHSVLVDVLSVMMERTSVISLEICGLLLPLLNELLSSENDRHILTAISLVTKLVNSFGTTIHATVSTPSSLGVDLQAEQRLERCKVCYSELQAVSRSLTLLTRKGGEVAKAAIELSTVLKDV